MASKSFKILFPFIIAIILTFGLSISFQTLLAAYTAPLHNPAACLTGEPGCDAPISSGSTLFQQMQGALWVVNSTYATNPYSLIVEQGKVGIGIAAPNYKLDVQGGQINASGGLCINGDCKTAWSQIGIQSETDPTVPAQSKQLNQWVNTDSSPTFNSVTANGSLCFGGDCRTGWPSSGGCPADYTFMSSGGVGGQCVYSPPAYSASGGSSVLLHSNTGSNAYSGCGNPVLKSTQLARGGTYKICYKVYPSCCWLSWGIYRNGAAVTSNYAYVNSWEGCEVVGGWSAGDTVELRANGGCAGCGCYEGADYLDLYIDVPSTGSNPLPTSIN